MKTAESNGHILLTSKECRDASDHLDIYDCPVCDLGLGICKICGAGESELFDYTCVAFQARRLQPIIKDTIQYAESSRCRESR